MVSWVLVQLELTINSCVCAPARSEMRVVCGALHHRLCGPVFFLSYEQKTSSCCSGTAVLVLVRDCTGNSSSRGMSESVVRRDRCRLYMGGVESAVEYPCEFGCTIAVLLCCTAVWGSK